MGLFIGSKYEVKEGVFIARVGGEVYAVAVRGVRKNRIFGNWNSAVRFARKQEPILEYKYKPNTTDNARSNGFVVIEDDGSAMGPFKTFEEALIWVAENATENDYETRITELFAPHQVRTGV